MSRKPKAHILPHSTRVAIAKYKEKNPKATARELSGKYSCTENQVRSALSDFKDGTLYRTAQKPSVKKKSVEILNDSEPDNLFERQYHTALAQMDADPDIIAETRISLLKDLTVIEKNIRMVALEKHLKSPDAVLIAAIIRRYEPDATNQRVLMVYKEEAERCKSSL